MSWRDRLRPGSFGGVPIEVLSHELSAGRRVQTYEYPLRDKSYTVDLGRKAREISLTAVIVGNDVFDRRDALLSAIERGAGLLVHPYHGEMQAICTSCNLSESYDEGGVARFSLSFVEALQESYPVSSLDTGGAVTSAAQAYKDAGLVAFSAQYGAGRDQPDYVVDSILSRVNAASGYNIDRLMDPSQVAALITGKGLPSSLSRIYSIYASLFEVRDTLGVAPLITSTLIADTAVKLASTPITVYDDALQDKQVFDRMAIQQSSVSTPEDHVKINAIRTAVHADFVSRSVGSARLRKVSVDHPTPALVLAYEYHGDPIRANEIVVRNNISNPAFALGQLSILSI